MPLEQNGAYDNSKGKEFIRIPHRRQTSPESENNLNKNVKVSSPWYLQKVLSNVFRGKEVKVIQHRFNMMMRIEARRKQRVD